MSKALACALAGSALFSQAARADPYFDAYIPSTSGWIISALNDGDNSNAVLGVDYTQDSYNVAYKTLLHILGPTPLSPYNGRPNTYHMPDHATYTGWGMTSIDPRTTNIPCCNDPRRDSPFTAASLASFIAYAAQPGKLPTLPGGPGGGSTLTASASLYFNAGPFVPVIGGVSLPQLVKDSVFVNLADSDRMIEANFKPNFGLNMAQAEQVCGCVFDWKQTITSIPDPSPFYARNNGIPKHITSKDAPISDPPKGGGWSYTATPDNSYPFYYDPKHDLPFATTDDGLNFSDEPTDPCLFGGSGAGTSKCGFSQSPPGSVSKYSTELVGILPDGSYMTFGVGFDWSSNFNGAAGGVVDFSTFKSYPGTTYGDGAGGVTIDQMFETYGSMDGPTASIPEPSTWAMLLTGLASLWLLKRRAVQCG